jgi:hypothetical protein
MSAEVVSEFAQALRARLGDDLVAAALFGSRARGDARPESDWDLFVVVRERPADRLAAAAALRIACAERAGCSPTVLLRSVRELESRLQPVYLDIAEDARVLAGEEYLGPKLQRIREITASAGLHRVRDSSGMHWQWDRPPKGHWSLDWDGYRDVA